MKKETQHVLHLEYSENESVAEFFAKTTDLLQGIDDLSNAILSSFGSDIQTVAVISDLHDGSLLATFEDMLIKFDEQKIRRYVKDPREALIDFLIAGRRGLLRLFESEEDVKSHAPQILEQTIEQSPLKAYEYKIQTVEVLKALSKISQKSRGFKMPPTLTIDDEVIKIVRDFAFSPKDMEGVEEQVFHQKGAFTIKKPDLVGTSKWTILTHKAIEVKIRDKEWIKTLKNHEVVLGCGDKIEGTLTTHSYITQDLEVAEVEYYLDDIVGIVPPNKTKQIPLIDAKEN